MKALLRTRFPNTDVTRLDALAELWTAVVEGVVEAMWRHSLREAPVLHIDNKPQLTLELANLLAHFETIIVEEMLKERDVEQIDLNAERARLLSDQERIKIENTGVLYYERVWKPILERAHARHPLVTEPSARSQRRSVIAPRGRGSGTKLQHYTPVFSNRYWAAPPQNNIRIYSLKIDLSVESQDRGYRTWGREEFLYSQNLERHLGLIEGDAQRVYEKLLDQVPLTLNEINQWVAFLATQHMRTPGYMMRILGGLVDHDSIPPRDKKIESLRRGYEQAFVANQVFATYHNLIAHRKWKVLTTPPERQLVRSDEPLITNGGATPWQLIYPMTPEHCFVVGPEPGKIGDLVEHISTASLDVERVNRRMAMNARRTVIARPTSNDESLRQLLTVSFRTSPLRHALTAIGRAQPWGAL